MTYPHAAAAGRDDPVARIVVDSVAFLSDVHANTFALNAVLAELAADPVQALVFNGDITWGSFPAETADIIRAARDQFEHVVLIRGNADRAVLELADSVRPPGRPRETWMRQAHRPSDVDLLRGCAFQADVEVRGLGVIRACHASPRADIEAISPQTPIARLAEATATLEADMLLTGHIHLQFDRPLTELPRLKRSVNPGSVGIPYGGAVPGAYWLRADTGGLHFRITDYDLNSYLGTMLSTDDPAAETIAGLLREPPTAAEVIADCESRVFAD